MIKRLFSLMTALIVVMVMLLGVVTPVSAAPLAWPKAGELKCTGSYASITNDTNDTLVGYSWAKANGSYVVTPSYDWGVSKNETLTVSWNPPSNFSGSVELHVELWKGMHKQDEKTVSGNLNCTPPHNYDVVIITQADCVKWERTQTITDNGQIVSMIVIESGVWSQPFVVETIPAKNYQVTLPDQTVVTVATPAIVEPANCQATHVVTSGVDKDCKEWSAYFEVDHGGKNIYAQGTWNDIYVLESAEVPAYDLPLIPGQVYDKTQIDALTVNEDEKCLVELKHDAEITVEDDCKTWSSSITTKDGGVATASTPESGVWSDPFILESADVSYDVVWPDGFKATFTKHISESDECLIGVAHFDISVDCGTERVGSWMNVTIASGHTTNFIDGKEVTDTKITLDNLVAHTYVAQANEGYLFADGTSTKEGTINKLEKCYNNPPQKECPKCGSNMKEIGEYVSAKTSQDCVPCDKGKNYGYTVSGTALHVRSEVEQLQVLVPVAEETLIKAGLVKDVDYIIHYAGKHKIKQVYLLTKFFEGWDKPYWRMERPIELTSTDGYVVYNMKFERVDGYGGVVKEFIACGLEYGGWFVRKDGTMELPILMNINTWDIENWLVTAGKFEDFKSADAWLVPLWKDAKLTGIIGKLP